MTRARPVASALAARQRFLVSGACGTTFIELLVALAVLGLGIAVVAMAAAFVLGAFESEPAAADVQQRGRAGVHAIVDDLERAGSGFYASADDGPGAALPALLADRLASTGWVAAARPNTVTMWHARRDTPSAILDVTAFRGTSILHLRRPPSCAPATACGFQVGDDLLVAAPNGRIEVAEVAAIRPPLDLDLTAPLGTAWAPGAMVAVVVPHTYERRADPATGLFQIVRSRASGPATPVVDFVTRFDVEWWSDAAIPRVVVAPDGTEEYASNGALPPPPGVTADPSWPPGENCAFTRDPAGVPVWRGGALSAAGPLPLAALGDGPWCPSPAAASRWDLDLTRIARVRIVIGVAAAVAQLRPALGLGVTRRAGLRPVPDLVLESVVRPGRLGSGGS